jgi:hypothetical protein
LLCDFPQEFFASLTVIDGHDEDPFPLVRCASFTRAEYSPRWISVWRFHSVSDTSQVGKDFAQSLADVTFDVLKEDESRPHGNNSICDIRPEVAGVFVSEPFPGTAKGLAWIPSR